MKRIADTSRAAYVDILASKRTRELDVLDALAGCSAEHGTPPTAYELLRWMQVRNATLDVNGVRPRLTELKDAGHVETVGKRRCAVTHKVVFTWTRTTNPIMPGTSRTSAAAAEPTQERLL